MSWGTPRSDVLEHTTKGSSCSLSPRCLLIVFLPPICCGEDLPHEDGPCEKGGYRLENQGSIRHYINSCVPSVIMFVVASL